MKNVRLGFHLIMLLLVVMTFAGVFNPPKTGNFAQDSGGWILPLIGILGIWVVGSIILRIARAVMK
jgi:hypothetical protein